MIDMAIIGIGPAGMSAAINAHARNKKVMLLGNNYKSNALYKSERIDNYLGLPGLSGKEMMDTFYAHVIKLDIEIKECKVLQILSMGDSFTINVDNAFDNSFIEAKTIIITTGAAKGSTIKGEKQYLGHGVSYCATCDGMLFRNKKVVVYSENKAGEKEADFLSGICNKVYYVPKYDMKEDLQNIEVIDSKPLEILGDDYVKGIKLFDKTVECDGVFMLKNTTPVDSLILGLDMNDNGSVKVNENMETNIKGIFAAGDCTGKPYQISKAIGEGLIASLQAVDSLFKQ